MLDLKLKGASKVIGDRSFSKDPNILSVEKYPILQNHHNTFEGIEVDLTSFEHLNRHYLALFKTLVT